MLLVEIGADAECAHFIVAQRADTLVRLAAQHRSQVGYAKALTGAEHARQRLLRDHACVPGLRRIEAVVAVAARIGEGLAEVREQTLAPACGRLRVAKQCIELAALDALALLARYRLRDELRQRDHVAESVAQPGIGRQSVAAGAAGFLVIAFHTFGQIQVRDEAYVWLVDTHAERNRRHHHEPILDQEAPLISRSCRRVHARVVRQRGDALANQPLRGVLHFFSRQAIDNPGRALVRDEELLELATCVVLLRDAIADVRPVETRNELARRFQGQPLDHLTPRRRIRGRGQRDAWNLGKALVQDRELAILRTEIVAPLRHTVCLVDCEQRDRHARQQVEAAFGQQPLRRDIEQFQRTIGKAPLDLALRRRILAGIEECRFDTELAQGIDLILHQRDKRRHHDRATIAQQRWNLIAQRLAATGRHQHQRIAAADHMFDDRLLLAAERGIAEDGPEYLQRGG